MNRIDRRPGRDRILTILLCVGLSGPARAGTSTTPPREQGAAAFTTQELDSRLEAKARAKSLAVSPVCDDASFLRRVSLDVVGVIPPPEEVESFLKDTDPDKRSRKIEELLKRPAFNTHWESVLSNVLLARALKPGLQVLLQNKVREWLSKEIAAGSGYDKIITHMITAEGPVTDNPAVGFVLSKEAVPEDLTGHTAKVLLGVQLQCAQCHNHPFEKWSQKDFYGLMGFWARTRSAFIPEVTLAMYRKGVPVQVIQRLVQMAKNRRAGGGGQGDRPGMAVARLTRFLQNQQMNSMMGGMHGGENMEADGESQQRSTPMPSPAEIIQMAREARAAADREKGNGKMQPRLIPVVFDGVFGEAVIADPNAPPPEKKYQLPQGERIAPKFLDGEAPPYPDDGNRDRRRELAAWITKPTNPYFAKAAVNRFFSVLTGHGLVEPVDNIAFPTETALADDLDRFASGFISSGFDIRWLIRTIVNSRTYQRSLVPEKGSEKDHTYFTHAASRQLSAEQLFSSLVKATGARNIASSRFETFKAFILRQFVFTYDTDEGNEVELFHETIPQALMLLNSRFINAPVQAIRVPGPAPADGGQPGVRVNSLYAIAAANPDPKDRIDRLFLSTLGRHGDTDEIEHFVAYVQAHSGGPGGQKRDRGFAQAPGFLTQGPPGGGALRGFDAPPAAGGPGMMAQARENDSYDDTSEHHDEAPDANGPVLPASTPNPFASRAERLAYEDVLWSLVTAAEFIYNH